jgi:hypothetical protein
MKFEKTTYYVGLAMGDLKFFEVTEGGPKLICEFDKAGKYSYVLHANASVCK